MTRRASFALLGVAALLVIGCALFVVVAIAGGVWQPRGPVSATPGPPTGPMTWDAALEEVRAGRVVHVSQSGSRVTLYENDRQFDVEVAESTDVQADLQSAAAEGGVAVPSFDRDGQPFAPPARSLSYAEFLDLVRAGRILDVTQEGQALTATGDLGQYEIAIPNTGTSVLDDIEQAAQAGGVDPPAFTKLPRR